MAVRLTARQPSRRRPRSCVFSQRAAVSGFRTQSNKCFSPSHRQSAPCCLANGRPAGQRRFLAPRWPWAGQATVFTAEAERPEGPCARLRGPGQRDRPLASTVLEKRPCRSGGNVIWGGGLLTGMGAFASFSLFQGLERHAWSRHGA